MSLPHSNELDTALMAAREAAALCRAVRAGVDPGTLDKKDTSPVTVADYGSQALVCRALKAAYPDDPVVGEEDAADLRKPENSAILAAVVEHLKPYWPDVDADSALAMIDHGGARAESERFWTLDPIDGTKGFLRNEQYAVAVALIVGGEVLVGVLGCPNLEVEPGSVDVGALFSAVKGQGASVRPLDDEHARPKSIHVRREANLISARFCESVESGHSAHGQSAQIAEKLGITAEPVRLDSQAKYAVVGRGEADIYLRLPTRADYREKIWDHAAGALVVTEAGGTVTDVDGKPLEFTHGRTLAANRGVIVSSGPMHDEVLRAAKAVGV